MLGNVRGASFVQHELPRPPFPHPREWALLPFKAKFTCTVIHCLLFVRSLTILTMLPLTHICNPHCPHHVLTFCKHIPPPVEGNRTAHPTSPSLAMSSLLPAQPDFLRALKLVSVPSLTSHSLPLHYSGCQAHQSSQKATRDPEPPLIPLHPSRPIINPLHFPPKQLSTPPPLPPLSNQLSNWHRLWQLLPPLQTLLPPQSEQAGSHNANLPSSPPPP